MKYNTYYREKRSLDPIFYPVDKDFLKDNKSILPKEILMDSFKDLIFKFRPDNPMYRDFPYIVKNKNYFIFTPWLSKILLPFSRDSFFVIYRNYEYFVTKQ